MTSRAKSRMDFSTSWGATKPPVLNQHKNSWGPYISWRYRSLGNALVRISDSRKILKDLVISKVFDVLGSPWVCLEHTEIVVIAGLKYRPRSIRVFVHVNRYIHAGFS